MAQSRAEKSILNAGVTLIFYFVNMAVTIFSRPAFFKYLGSEVEGMRSILSTIFYTLSIAELGVGGAISYMLYKPLANKDTQTMNEIISVQAWFYRRIALFITIVSSIILLFIPYIFTELKPMQAPTWYATAAFSVSFVNTIIGYTLNYRSGIFAVDQRGYRLAVNTQGFIILRNLLQLLVLIYVPNPFPYYLLLELSMTIIGAIVLESMIQKDYPWLKPKPKQGKALLQKYPQIIVKTKQLFLHRLGYIASSNIMPIVFVAYVSLSDIAAYGNYQILYGNLGVIANAFFNSVSGGGVGTLIAEGNKDKYVGFFWEFLSIKHYVATLIAFALFMYSQYLLPIWLGDNPAYLLPMITLGWIALNSYINISRGVVDAYIIAQGMYRDTWAPIADLAVNAVASLTLGYFFGINGAIAGSVLAFTVIPLGWKTTFLFRESFGMSPWLFWRKYALTLIIAISTIGGAYLIVDYLAIDFSTLPKLLLNGTLVGLVYASVLLGIYAVLLPESRSLAIRIYEFAGQKLRRRKY